MTEIEYPRPDWLNYRYRLEMWSANTAEQPQRMGMNDLDASWQVAIALTKDGTWHSISIVDNINNMEWGRISSMKWYKGLGPDAQYAGEESGQPPAENGED